MKQSIRDFDQGPQGPRLLRLLAEMAVDLGRRPALLCKVRHHETEGRVMPVEVAELLRPSRKDIAHGGTSCNKTRSRFNIFKDVVDSARPSPL